MEYVIAKGYKDGNNIAIMIVKQSKGGLVAHCNDYRYIDSLQDMLDGDIVVGGTYTAPMDSLLKAYHCAEQFLDSVTDITVEGEIEQIPYEDGLIY